MRYLKRWWSKKYKLPLNHPLLLKSSASDLTLEMYEDMLENRDKLREALKEATDRKVRANILEAITAINKVFDEAEETEDAQVDQWEAELAEGKIPDLE